jgi:hypothetical protein
VICVLDATVCAEIHRTHTYVHHMRRCFSLWLHRQLFHSFFFAETKVVESLDSFRKSKILSEVRNICALQTRTGRSTYHCYSAMIRTRTCAIWFLLVIRLASDRPGRWAHDGWPAAGSIKPAAHFKQQRRRQQPAAHALLRRVVRSVISI